MGRTPYKGLNTMILGVSDITALTNDQVASLNAGQVVLEDNESGQKLFKVTSKTADKMSLVFTDHEKIKEVKYAYQLIHSQTWRDKINSCFGPRLTEDGKGVILTADELNNIAFKEVARKIDMDSVPSESPYINSYVIYNNVKYDFKEHNVDSIIYEIADDDTYDIILWLSNDVDDGKIVYNNTINDENELFQYNLYIYNFPQLVNAFKESTITLTPTQLNDTTYSYLRERINNNGTNEFVNSVIEYNNEFFTLHDFELNDSITWRSTNNNDIVFWLDSDNGFTFNQEDDFIDSITIFNASYIVDNILPDLEANTPDPEAVMMWVYQETVETEIPTEQDVKGLIQADKDVISQIEYDEGSNGVIFPKGVMPIRFMTSSEEIYYLDYADNNDMAILDANGDNISGTIVGYDDENKRIGLDIANNTLFNKFKNIHDMTYICIDGFDTELNTYNLYHPAPAGTKIYKLRITMHSYPSYLKYEVSKNQDDSIQQSFSSGSFSYADKNITVLATKKPSVGSTLSSAGGEFGKSIIAVKSCGMGTDGYSACTFAYSSDLEITTLGLSSDKLKVYKITIRGGDPFDNVQELEF